MYVDVWRVCVWVDWWWRVCILVDDVVVDDVVVDVVVDVVCYVPEVTTDAHPFPKQTLCHCNKYLFDRANIKKDFIYTSYSSRFHCEAAERLLLIHLDGLERTAVSITT